jgi:hypothetical protein
MANSFPGSGLAYADAFSVGNASSVNSSLYVCSSCVQAVRIEHNYNQDNLHHNTLWLRANNAGALEAASIGFTVVNDGGDHHRANIAATGNAGALGGNLAIYTRRSSDGADVLGFYQNNIGNVGIGITSPSEKLHLNNASGTGTFIRFQDTGGDGVYIGSRSNIMELYAGGAERMRITSGGCVGIGTSSPTQRFHVAGTSLFTDTMNFELGKISWNSTRFVITSCGTANIAFATDDFTDRMTIQCGTGNVGIGCTTPTNTLEVNGTGRFACNVNIGTSASSTSRFQLNFLNWNTSNSYPYITFQNPTANCRHGIGINTSNDFVIGRATGVNCNFIHQDFVIVNSTGNIGIGITSPIDKLEVAGGIHTSGTASASKSCTGYLDYYLGQVRVGITGPNTTTPAIFRIDQYSSNASIYCTPFYITATSNIGVNTTSPSYRLHVNGTFYAAGSSQDYKEGICQYNTDSCLFMCLKPKTYQYKDEWKHLGKDLKSETQIGLIAEEVAESHPELAILVNEDDNKVVRNVDYEKLSIVLLAEVQKLRHEMDQLKQN